MIADDDKILAQFEDLIALHEEQLAAIRGLHGEGGGPEEDGEEDFDEGQLKPIDATSLSAHELHAEMERRGIHPKGFRADDERLLQAELNREHHEYVEKLRKERHDNREKIKRQAAMHRRRLLMEQQLREEQEEVAGDHRMEFWLSLIRQNATSEAARIEVNSITARALAKAMWDNHSVTSLDLSNCDLDDIGGAYIGRMLKHNDSLVKLEMGSNCLGPKTTGLIAGSLMVNQRLRHLDLQSSLLTAQDKDRTGFAALCQSLRHNRTLVSLNLSRCELGEQAGRDLSLALQDNHTLLFLEVGYNDFRMDSNLKIAEKLQDNRERLQQQADQSFQEGQRQAQEELYQKSLADKIKKDHDYRQWLEEQKQMRVNQRCQTKNEEAALRRAAQEALDQADQAKYEEEKKAREEAEAKKKKKAAAAKKK